MTDREQDLEQLELVKRESGLRRAEKMSDELN